MSNVLAVGTGRHIRVFEKLDGVLVGHKCVISCVREGSVLVKVMGGLYRGHTKEVSLEKDEWVLLRRTCHEDGVEHKCEPCRTSTPSTCYYKMREHNPVTRATTHTHTHTHVTVSVRAHRPTSTQSLTHHITDRPHHES